MQQASRALEFEKAAELRDMILELDGTLPGASAEKTVKPARTVKAAHRPRAAKKG